MTMEQTKGTIENNYFNHCTVYIYMVFKIDFLF